MSNTMYCVVRPEGVRWASRYKTPEAAWSHLLGVKRVQNTKTDRQNMLRLGWKVVPAQRKPI